MARASLNWPDEDMAAARVAAAAAGKSFNEWLRRAAGEAAALERAVEARDVEVGRVGVERPGWDVPEFRAAVSTNRGPYERVFRPDPRPSSKKR